MCIGYQSGQGFKSPGFGSACFHQYHRSSGIVDTRSVPCCHRAVFFDEHRFELGHVSEGAIGAEMLVGLVCDIAFFAFEDDGGNLAGEVTRLGCALGAVVAFNGQGILDFSGDSPFGCDVFCGHAHMDILKRVVQSANDHVHHFGVPHAGAPAHIERGKRTPAHVFCAPANGYICVAKQNTLAGIDNRLEAGAAQAVHIKSRCSFTASAVDRRNP